MDDIEIPVFREKSDRERISEIEKWIVSFAELMRALPFEIGGFQRTGLGEGSDEITITYPDGTKVRYDLPRSQD